MSLMTRMEAVASRLIGAYGFDTVIRRVTFGSVDPVTGESTQYSTEFPVKAVATELKAELIDGTLIQVGDRMYVLTAAVEPANGDSLKVGDKYWQIVSWSPKQVQDGNVAYQIQVRR
jgi:hypothetical protein